MEYKYLFAMYLLLGLEPEKAIPKACVISDIYDALNRRGLKTKRPSRITNKISKKAIRHVQSIVGLSIPEKELFLSALIPEHLELVHDVCQQRQLHGCEA